MRAAKLPATSSKVPVGAGIGAAGRTSANREADPEAVREAELAARRPSWRRPRRPGSLHIGRQCAGSRCGPAAASAFTKWPFDWVLWVTMRAQDRCTTRFSHAVAASAVGPLGVQQVQDQLLSAWPGFRQSKASCLHHWPLCNCVQAACRCTHALQYLTCWVSGPVSTAWLAAVSRRLS